jgi:hypothetical protein
MDVLDHTLIWDWCREHGVALDGDDADTPVPITLADDPALSRRARVFYAEGQRSGRERVVAAAAVDALGAWDECLVWLTGWGVWASGEDWPRFYAWRGAHGERRSLEAAPGHLFRTGEVAQLEELLGQILENGWDAALLPARGGTATDRRVVTSHDEWVDVRSRDPVEFSVAAG